MSSKVHY